MTTLSHDCIDPAFTIRITPARGLVEIVLLGFWDATIAERFDRQFRAVLPRITAGGYAIGQQLAFIDLTGYIVQNQNTLEHLAGLAGDPTIAARRSAILVSSTLLKRQAMRTAPNYGVFSDRAAAMAWLTDD